MKKDPIGAYRGTFSRQGKLYDLGKIKAPLSRHFYQASCGIGGIYRNLSSMKLNRGSENEDPRLARGT